MTTIFLPALGQREHVLVRQVCAGLIASMRGIKRSDPVAITAFWNRNCAAVQPPPTFGAVKRVCPRYTSAPVCSTA